ncbi:MAG: septum formation initiator family protein [Halanaerobiales bacterium]|nr:septum formation initiator family protein [Halanaerobiales bacterium]
MNFETFFKKAMILLLIIVIIIFSFRLFMNMRKVNEMEQRLDRLSQEYEEKIEQNQQLKEEIERVKSPAYIEKVAREELGLVKPGEILLIPVEEDEQQNEDDE